MILGFEKLTRTPYFYMDGSQNCIWKVKWFISGIVPKWKCGNYPSYGREDGWLAKTLVVSFSKYLVL